MLTHEFSESCIVISTSRCRGVNGVQTACCVRSAKKIDLSGFEEQVAADTRSRHHVDFVARAFLGWKLPLPGSAKALLDDDKCPFCRHIGSPGRRLSSTRPLRVVVSGQQCFTKKSCRACAVRRGGWLWTECVAVV